MAPKRKSATMAKQVPIPTAAIGVEQAVATTSETPLPPPTSVHQIILSETPIEERQRVLNCKICKGLKNVRVIQQVGNPMSRADIRMAVSLTLINQKPRSSFKQASTDYKEMPLSIVVIPDKSLKSGDRSRPDKRSVFALILAEDVYKELKIEVASLVAEFADTELGKQAMNLRPQLSVIGTDEITGLVTAQVAEQCELNDVWTELLNSWGNEIYMKNIERYLKEGESLQS